jgi:hypothetical protein
MNKVEVVCSVEVADHVLDLGPQRVRIGQNYMPLYKLKKGKTRRYGAWWPELRLWKHQTNSKMAAFESDPKAASKALCAYCPLLLNLFHVHTKTLGPTESFDRLREEAY